MRENRNADDHARRRSHDACASASAFGDQLNQTDILIKSGRTHSIISSTRTSGCARRWHRQKGVGTGPPGNGPEAPVGTASQGRTTTGVRAPAGDRDVGTVVVVTCVGGENGGAAAPGAIGTVTVPVIEGTGTPASAACSPPPPLA